MGLTQSTAEEHVCGWSKRLKDSRTNWPGRLFRHEPVENAVQILTSGRLLSRNASTDLRRIDVAPAQIIEQTDAAHNFVRLYFRPKNPTQYHIEGIAKASEYYLGNANHHAAILVIFIFDSQEILTRESCSFSNGNVQNAETTSGNDDEFFRTINFGFVYHEGAFDRHSSVGAEIIRARCAEVLLPSPLQLDPALKGILCRSSAERATLLHMLGPYAPAWAARVRVHRDPGLFQKRFTFLDSFDASDEGVVFAMNPRWDSQAVLVEINVTDRQGRTVLNYGPRELPTSNRWQIKHQFPPGLYLARVKLEGVLAYEAEFLIDDAPF